MRCFWVIWSVIAWFSAILCTAGCLLPYWLKGSFEVVVAGESRQLVSHLGIFRRCVYPVYVHQKPLQNVGNVTVVPMVGLQAACGYYEFEDIPQLTWKVGFVGLSFACSLLFFITFFLFIAGFNLQLLAQSCVYKICQFGLLVSGLLVMFACLMYPIGWQNNEEVRQICGDRVDSFRIEKCRIGWAYVLTIAGGLLSLLATVLPCLFSMERYAAIHHQRTNYGPKLPQSKNTIVMTTDPDFQMSDMTTQTVLLAPNGSTWVPVNSQQGNVRHFVASPDLSLHTISSQKTNNSGSTGRPQILYQSVSTVQENPASGHVAGYLVPVEQHSQKHYSGSSTPSERTQAAVVPRGGQTVVRASSVYH